MNEVIQEFRTCDALIVATPVYYRTPTAQLLSLFQRHYCIQNEKPLQGKPGGAIAVGRGTSGGQATSISTIYNWMLSCGMICVPGELNGVTASADAPGDILKQEIRLNQAIQLGKNIKELAETLFKGRQSTTRP
jgi:multimeric flavodoxin WrbA